MKKGKILANALMTMAPKKPKMLPINEGKPSLYEDPGEVKLRKLENARIKGLA